MSIEEGKITTHCKKGLAVFPAPAGMSLTKLSLGGNNLIFPAQGEFSQWRPGWGRENGKLFLQCREWRLRQWKKCAMANLSNFVQFGSWRIFFVDEEVMIREWLRWWSVKKRYVYFFTIHASLQHTLYTLIGCCIGCIITVKTKLRVAWEGQSKSGRTTGCRTPPPPPPLSPWWQVKSFEQVNYLPPPHWDRRVI